MVRSGGRRLLLVVLLVFVPLLEAVKPLLCLIVSVKPVTPVVVASAAFLYDLVGVGVFAALVYYVGSSLGGGPALWDVFRAVVLPCIAAGWVYVVLALLATLVGSPFVYFLGVAVCLVGKFFSQIVGPAVAAGRVLGVGARRLLLPSLAAYAAMMVVGVPLAYFLSVMLGGVVYVCRVYAGYTATLSGLVAEWVAALVYVWAAGALFRSAMGPPRRS